MAAETIGLASGLLALSTFAFQSSITLYKTVQSFQFHPKYVRELNEELEALNGVLCSLSDTITASIDVDLSALKLPLLSCGRACNEFEQLIIKCSSRSGGSRTSFRDWAKVQYMGDNIDGFKRMLAGYKSTINIALTDANLRNSSLTAERIESYKDLIKNATADLEDHLRSIDEKLESIFTRSVTQCDSDAPELQLMKEERLSTQQCLQICAQLSAHIDQIQVRPTERSRSPTRPISVDALPEKVTNDGLQKCRDNLDLTTAKLERHLQSIIEGLITKSKTTMASEREVADLSRLREEWNTARQCIDICSKAGYHLKESITIIDNYSTGDDAVQFLVSTDGKTVHGKNAGFGARPTQVGGHLSDASVQQISRDFSRTGFRSSGGNSPPPRENTPTADTALKKESTSEFRERYGPGIKLLSKSTPDMIISSTELAEVDIPRIR
ncbi:hypothetical protein HD806DRAFT_487509 [Xylariaceae sp. AK1471]|nr:hypothetical protein HD806DRAFT_487509 [Xylariaceae sp. AK1471]